MRRGARSTDNTAGASPDGRTGGVKDRAAGLIQFPQGKRANDPVCSLGAGATLTAPAPFLFKPVHPSEVAHG